MEIRGTVVSNNFRIFLLLVFAPFLAFWGVQMGDITGNAFFNEPTQPFTLWPEHFGWCAAAGALGAWALLGSLLGMAARWIFPRRMNKST